MAYKSSYTGPQIDQAVSHAVNMDVNPTAGHTDRVVSSGGVKSAISAVDISSQFTISDAADKDIYLTGNIVTCNVQMTSQSYSAGPNPIGTVPVAYRPKSARAIGVVARWDNGLIAGNVWVTDNGYIWLYLNSAVTVGLYFTVVYTI